MTAIIIIGAALLLALVGGEIGDAMNMAAGQKSAPAGARFGAGCAAVGIMVSGAAIVMLLLLLARLLVAQLGGSPAP